MKMKRLMSICAISLAVACCTSASAFAAQTTEGREASAKKLAISFFKENQVIEGIDIRIDTPIEDYATDGLIKEFENLAKDLGINTFDKTKGIKENLEKIKENQNTLKTTKNLNIIKKFVKGKLNNYEEAENLANVIKRDFKVAKYGDLKIGKNINGKTTATLEKNNKILFQVNTDNIYNMKNELSGIDSWSQLKTAIKKYAPNSILNYYKMTK
ncbi:hypothetical protein [Clostridium taeniosporum]|uniref:DUF5105 domain-containing protein n=1 Tax=Clostridium taeniosporum TaxID=394958 RepID=A0A1D7XMZ9_9CLOT|nr:hypothetical protein [Clostridium taeniosporum]AOR24733.1 hypothetical protein BGI42_13755 [Clostridium taeniosporum]